MTTAPTELGAGAGLDGVRVAIVTPYLPDRGRSGHGTYLSVIVDGLLDEGARVDLVLVAPWPAPVVSPIDPRVGVVGRGVVQRRGRVAVVSPRPLVRNVGMTLIESLPSALRTRVMAVRDRLRDRRSIDHVLFRPLPPDEVGCTLGTLRRLQPDAVMINGHGLGTAWCPADLPVVAIAHDSIAGRFRSLAERGYRTVPERFGDDDERALLAGAAGVTAIQPDDRDHFRRLLPDADVVWVPPAFDAPPVPDVGAEAGRCLFVGSASLHNADGLAWFLDDIWPLVRERVPSARLRVVGSVCDRLDRADPGVEWAGRVDDLSSEYARAAVALVPLRVGSGLKIKAVEALAHGCPVIASTVGAEGLVELVGLPLEVADVPDGFARAVCRLLDPAPTAERAASARRAASYFGEGAATRTLEQLIGDVVGSLRASSGTPARTRRP